MRVLITGGAGFIGSALAGALVERGDEVTVLDNLSPQIHGEEPARSPLFLGLPAEVDFHRGDVRNVSDWESVISGQDAIVHLAAETGTGQSMYEIDRYVDVNVRGTSLMLDLLARKAAGSETVHRLVVASSRSIYGEGKYQGTHGFVYPGARAVDDLRNGIFECRDPGTGEIARPVATDEDSRIHPSSIYGITKQVQEQLILTAGNSLGIGAIGLRYQNVYGPGQSLKNPYTGILSIFSTQLLQGKPVNIFEDGEETRDFVYIDDVVRATVAAVDCDVSGRALNVGTGVPTDVMSIAQTLKAFYNSPSEIAVSGNFRVGDIRHNFADLTRIERELGFISHVSFDEGLKKFTEWVSRQEIVDAGYDKSVSELRLKGLLQ
jgi:dTDP-L-rhamnose 4-epimerase